ncbi:MAG: FimV family protein [Gammaproteobacteria bacterium]|nr:FimV family protein [Gammaproteobacteria bacterium]
MVRKLSLMLVLTIALVPLAAQALGLGDISPNSALNQAFNAEIKLLSVSKREIYDIRVSMASDEAYKRSGVDRTYILSKLRFSPEIKADGTAIIRVTSSEPIREPFMNFLIEVNWPKGRLVREYTVLLDPPVTLERRPAPIQAPAVTRTRVVAPKVRVVAPKVRVVAPKAPVEMAKPKKLAKSTISASKMLKQSVHPAYVGNLDEVKVKKNASLWVIARKHEYSEVDHHRMMMAIYYANPHAFIKNNINRLKQGAILRIPNKDDILSLGKRDAQKEYKQHVDAWHSDTEIARVDPGPPPVLQYTSEPMAPSSEREQTAELQNSKALVKESLAETETETETETAKESVQDTEGELKIATARPEGKGEAGPSEDSEADQTIARLKQELLIVEEDAERSRGEGEELASRVDDLEEQLEDVERLLELKSEQLANVQAALAKSQEEQGFLERSNKQLKGELAYSQEHVVAESAKGESATEVAEEKTKPVVEDATPESVVEETKPEPVVEETKPEPVAEETKPEPVVEDAEPKSVIKPIADAEPKSVPVAKEPAQELAQEPSLLDQIMSNPTMLGIVVGAIIILLGLVWILLSRKRASTADFQDSILLNNIDDEAPDALNEIDDISSHTEETSFLSDFSPSDIDALQDETGEVDPLSEADVYIAYGRYQQAEELIRQAIDKESDRSALKYKLFEILYAVKDKEGFVSLVEKTVGTEVESGDSKAWDKVLSMGKTLLPEHPMFAGADEIDSDDDLFSLDESLLDDELDENDFADLDATLTQVGSDVEQDGSDAGGGTEADAVVMDDALLDSELLNLSNELNAAYDGLDDTVTEPEGLEFDASLDDDSISDTLEELEGLGDQVEIGAQQADEDELEDEDDLMLSLSDLEDESEKTVLSLHAAASMKTDDAEELTPAQAPELTDDASGMEQELSVNELEEAVIDLPEDNAGTAEFELDATLAVLDGAEDDAAEDLGVSISVDEDMQDEVKTKLDLAHAYAEMGDTDGAIDILDEVLSEGNESQKQEAQQIKESLT